MFQKKDTTFDELREKSFKQWLDEIEHHEDLVVSGGVALARSYVKHLEDEIARLNSENELKKSYLKKMAAKAREK